MTSTVTGSYGSADQMRNAKDELIAAGIPRDQVFVDESASQVKVMVPESSRPGIIELLERHGLKVAPPVRPPAASV